MFVPVLLAFVYTGQVYNVCCGASSLLSIRIPGRIENFWYRSADGNLPQGGDIVRVDGHRDLSKERNADHFADFLTKLGHADLPAVQDVAGHEVLSWKALNRHVGVQGVVNAVFRDENNSQWNIVLVNTGSGTVRAVTPENEHPLAELSELLDAEVTLRGFCLDYGAWRNFLGPVIMIYGNDGIRVNRPRSADPFDVPSFSLYPTPHRQSITATVICLTGDRAVMRIGSGQLCSMPTADNHPKTGEELLVSGFFSWGPLGIEISSPLCRRIGEKAAVDATPRPLVAEQLFEDPLSGHHKTNYDLFGSLVTIRGTVSDALDAQGSSSKITVRTIGHAIAVDMSALALREIPAVGSLIEVSGTCLGEFKYDQTIRAPTFRNYLIVPRTSGDVKVVRAPSWWTPIRFVLLIAALLLVIIVITAWNHALRRLANRQARQLCREMLLTAKSELIIEERTRLATEIHDTIAQMLTGVALQIEAGNINTAKLMLASCRKELKSCIWDMRNIVFDERNFRDAIEQTIAPLVNGIRTSIAFAIPKKMFPKPWSLMLLKVIRELTVNAVQHGQANSIAIDGYLRDGIATATVSDDGRGFDPSCAPGPEQGHFGLTGIRERLKPFGGTLVIESRRGKGTVATVKIRIPTDDNE